MATEAARLMLQCVCNGSLSLFEMDIERRPNQKNCSCDLHKSKGSISIACFPHQNISFPKKRMWNNMSLTIIASKFSSPSSLSHNTSSIEEINEILSSRK